jgi:uncharacterized repeat protein (TIGR01451 family)
MNTRPFLSTVTPVAAQHPSNRSEYTLNKTTTLSRMVRPALSALVLTAIAVLAPTTAEASTAAYTPIRNVATINYQDAGGTPQTAVTAQVIVTVALVPAAPTVSKPADTTASQGATLTLNYTVTGNANGPDTYTLSSTESPTNISTETATPSAGSVALGGTTLAAATVATSPTITVPYDGTDDDIVNGIVVGATVVINGTAFTVNSINETGAMSSTITLNANVGAIVAVGTIVGERRTFTVSVPAGTVSVGFTQGQQAVVTRATSTADNTIFGTHAATLVTVYKPSLTVTKLVAKDAVTFGGDTTAVPGATLTYKIRVRNTSSASATSVVISDPLPEYLTYVTNSGKSTQNNATTYAAATAVGAPEGYSYNAGTRTVSFTPAVGAGGTLAANAEVILFFQATINN